MSITVCLVTRNHADSLERAVRSVAGVATEVVVADTGSTDDTVPLAGRLGARVVPIAWAEDFARACNDALSAATGDWVLWLNPDEELGAGGAGLAQSVGYPNAFAYRLRVQQELTPTRRGFGTADWQVRLYRRDPDIRYVGRLYPRLDPSADALATARGLQIGVANATIHRHAYLSKPTPDKLRFAVRLLEAELRDRPGQLPYLIQYGRHLLWLNDPAGHEVLADAAGRVKPLADSPTAPDPEVGRLIEYLLNVSPDLNRGPITRDEARALAGKWFADTPPVVWAVAAERTAAGDHRTAAEQLERLVWMGQTGRYDVGGGFDPDIVGNRAKLTLAAALTQLGRWDAVKAVAGPLTGVPEYREHALKLLAAAEQASAGGAPASG